ncbi:MAG: glycerophosphodiester phosphodiesterase [Porphyromonadaceae bacterium]|jgi:glycerophosphoryl diester phosphodiesterase|nr:glycerophosphodiester phosphodiesterase [Porphyromonadaceae bacterium]
MKKIILPIILLLVHLTLLSQTQIIAHRGYWNTPGSAQNSIVALKKADSIAIYGSELDVWMSSDGVPMVNHDDSIFFNGKKISVQDTDHKTLKSIKLSNGESMPTLKEYLKEFKKTKDLILIIELKKHRTKLQEDLLAKKTIKMVKALNLQHRVEYISFGLNLTTGLIHLNPKAKVYYLNGDLSPAVMKEIGAAGIDYHYSVIQKNPTWVKQAHDLGLKVNVWTVNKPAEIRRMLDLNVDFITTDEPLLVKELRQ